MNSPLLVATLIACTAMAAAQDVRRVRVGGTELAYVERGSGQPVVLIHGFMWDYRVWERPLEDLSKDFRVVAYSRRHHWPNPPPTGNDLLSLTVGAADLAGFIRAAGLAPAHLIGHSAGANIALLVARDHPDLVASIVLGEPGPALSSELKAVGPDTLNPALARARQALLEGDDERAIRIIVGGVSGKASVDPLPPELMRVWMDNMPVTRAQLTGARAESPPSLSCEDLGRIDTPALVMVGQNSLRVFRSVQADLLRCLPRAKSVTLQGANHGLFLQNPEGFQEAVLAFLKK